MNKIACLFSILLLAFFAAGTQADVKNLDTFVLADYRTVQTIDPAASYDVAGSMRIWNLYETLIFFDGSSTEQFVPLLATEVPTVKNGGISPDGKTYRFTIRKGVKFHEGGTLTPEDVVYSFKRNMIMDPDGSPMWMLLEALTGHGSTRDKEGKIIDGIENVEPYKRREIYSRLQDIWYEDAIGIPLYQQIVVRAYRDYVHGFISNAMFTDDNEILKRIWKK